MKRHVTKNFVKAMFACFMLTLSMVTIPVCVRRNQMQVLSRLVVL